MSAPIHVFCWPTPNGRKPLVMLEELDLPYEIEKIAISKGEQHTPEFLEHSPNNKIPAIIDPDGPGGEPISIFESGAILIYLAEKHGRYLPDASENPRGRVAVLEWLMWQMGGVGPMIGQNGYFSKFAKVDVPHAKERYATEMDRLFRVADRRLAKTTYLAGEDYSIADIATYPWLRMHEFQGQSLDGLDNVKRWLDLNAERPAVQRAMAQMS